MADETEAKKKGGGTDKKGPTSGKMKGYIMSEGMAPGEDFAAKTEPWYENPDSESTAMEIGEPQTIPANPYGPTGFPKGKKQTDA
jgi:hypothetical protein